MCDTVVVNAPASHEGVTLFAKNSDREPNEAQFVELIPPADHPEGSRVQCTYLAVPQVRHTYGMIISRPFWMWGAEMGVNEHGVAVGNEAVFTRLPYRKQEGLLGMDLLRLALERADTAERAVEVITSLLERYGQGGNCGYGQPFHYHNSFLIADPRESWVLETADREWVARRVHGIYALSNGLTIGTEWDRASADLIPMALRKGWCRDPEGFHFRRCYSDCFYTYFSHCRYRRACSLGTLKRHPGRPDVYTLLTLLRDHGTTPGREDFHPDRGWLRSTVCMHAGFGPVRRHQTTASLVALLHPERPLVLITGTAAPCTSIFKPLWWDTPIGGLLGRPAGRADAHSLFWQHERLHRLLLQDFAHRLSRIQEERNHLEAQFVQEALSLNGADVKERRRLAQWCVEEARSQESRWYHRLIREPIRRAPSRFYLWQWRRWNRQAGLQV